MKNSEKLEELHPLPIEESCGSGETATKTALCNRCQKVKKASDYTKDRARKNGLRSICRECTLAYRLSPERKAYEKDYVRRNRSAINEKSKIRRQANREEINRKQREQWPLNFAKKLMKDFGMSMDAYNALLASQNYTCAICGTREPGGKSNKWHLDHDHGTNEVRGFLCAKCNWAIGLLEDNPETVAKAKEYLEKYKKKSVATA